MGIRVSLLDLNFRLFGLDIGGLGRGLVGGFLGELGCRDFESIS